MTGQSIRSRAPAASSDAIRKRMERQRRRDTSCEVEVRRRLHAAGLRFRVDRRPVAGLRRTADLVLARARVAVFVDGCFWHGCPQHATWPKANREWWREKIEANIYRDRDTDRALDQAGWTVVRVWEHENPVEAAARVTQVVSEARRSLALGEGRSSRPRQQEEYMAGQRKTGSKAEKAASRVLRSKSTGKDSKSAAGSAFSQRAPKGGNKKR